MNKLSLLLLPLLTLPSSSHPHLRHLQDPSSAPTVDSCAKADSTGLYTLDKDGDKLAVQCEALMGGGGWTRVARINAPWQGYCMVDVGKDFLLKDNPNLQAGKLDDDDVNKYVLDGKKGYEVMLKVIGTQGKGEFMTAQVEDQTYDTSKAQQVSTWTCADGTKEDLPPVGGKSVSCGCGPMGGTGDVDELNGSINNRQVILGCKKRAESTTVFGMHAGGQVCGLDNRGAYPVDVYVRPLDA